LIAGATSFANALNEELVHSMTKLLRLVKMAGVSGEGNQHNDTLPDKVDGLLPDLLKLNSKNLVTEDELAGVAAT